MWPLGVTSHVFLPNVLISKNSILAYLHPGTYNQINTCSLLWFSWRNNVKNWSWQSRVDEDLNNKEDGYRQIKGEYMKKSLPGFACELNSLFLAAHTNTSHYLQPAGQCWLYITSRKACVSAWNGVKWSWNWCCWSSSVPSGHESLPQNDCTLQTQPQGKILDLSNY